MSIRRHQDAYLVSAAHVNWVLVEDGHDLTLIDGGYPGNAADVERSVREIGHQMSDVRGALLTHAHVDHLGGLAVLADRYGFPVFTGADEVAHAHRDHLQQMGPAQIPLLLWRRGSVRWVTDIVRLGGTDRTGVEGARPYDPEQPLPGTPVPVATPGHTDGHTCYLIPGSRVLVTGDALVTGHAVSSLDGPQLIVRPFSHDRESALASLDAIADVDADVIFPGHGRAWEGSPAKAATLARETAGFWRP
ncbi:UNVERIFIED_CONTAM: hypothetical protein LK11_04625 [Mumia flava]